MNKLQSNKELVAVGHQLTRALSSDTPIIDIAKILSHLAERLDCTTAALRATQAERDRLAAITTMMDCSVTTPMVNRWKWHAAYWLPTRSPSRCLMDGSWYRFIRLLPCWTSSI